MTPIHVLVIEDNPGDAELIRHMLSASLSSKATLSWAKNLTDGIQRLQNNRVDVVLLDLGLPESNGLSTVQKLRAQITNMPTLVVMSGLSDEDIAVQALQAGAQDYLVKGQVDGDMLARTIRYARERSQADEALRKAHNELTASEQRFRHFAESASDWFWETDANLCLSYLSERYFQLNGLSAVNVMGKPFREVFSGTGDQNTAWQSLIAAMETRQAFRDHGYITMMPNNRQATMRLSGRAFFDEAGSFLGYRGTGTDVTDLVKTQAQLIRSEKMAALGDLVAYVTHEVCTPLGIALMSASHFEDIVRDFEKQHPLDTHTDDDIRTLVETAMEISSATLVNLKRATELMGSFKQLAVDYSSEQKRHFNLNDYLKEILTSLQPRLKRGRHKVNLLCPSDIILDSYPSAFSQLMTNLILNSLIHGFEEKDDGRIQIELYKADDAVVMHYVDDGKGMPSEQANRMYEPFFTTKRSQGGSGLGMHIVYTLVTQTLGGQIDCQTAPGHGMSFVMRFPLSIAPATSAQNR